MGRVAVAGFRPSLHGFRFANAFPPGPTVRLGPLDPRLIGIGDASAGLCGGMALTVRDLFEAGTAPPADPRHPANGSPRFRALVRRQVESLDWLRVPLRYLDLQALRPDPPTAWSRSLHRDPARVVAVRDEWPRVRGEIDAGRLPVIGLVRVASLSPTALTRNHQVLGYAYEVGADGSAHIAVYDPNHPGDDAVELRLEADAGGEPRLSQSTGEPLVGFFVQPYPRPRSVLAWR